MGCVVSKKAVFMTPTVESSGMLREHRQGPEVVLARSSWRRRAKKEGLANEEGDRWDQGASRKVSIKSTSWRVPRLALQWHRVLSLLSSSSAASSTPSPFSSYCSSSSSPSLSGGVGFWPWEMRKGIGRARIKCFWPWEMRKGIGRARIKCWGLVLMNSSGISLEKYPGLSPFVVNN